MSRALASIQQVSDILPIEGKDKIKLAKILGWNVIVDSTIQKNEEVVFIEVDSVLPENPVFEFLRKRCYSETQKGFVIKTLKMGGVISQGIVFHVNDLLPNEKNLKIGQDVTELLNIKQRTDTSDNNDKVEQKKKTYLQTIVYRLPFYNYFKNKFKISGDFPSNYISKSDETRIQSLGQKFLDQHIGKKIVVTEKMEGQSATYFLKKVKYLGLFTKYIFKCYGRNMSVGPGHNIYNYAIDNDIKNKMIAILEDNKKMNYVSLQGEMCGNKIQKNYYNFDKHRFFIFKIAYNNKEMCFPCLKAECDLRQLEHVPVISVETLTQDKNVEYWCRLSTNKSLMTADLREGIVVRSLDVNSKGLTDFSFKAVSPEYCLKRGY